MSEAKEIVKLKAKRCKDEPNVKVKVKERGMEESGDKIIKESRVKEKAKRESKGQIKTWIETPRNQEKVKVKRDDTIKGPRGKGQIERADTKKGKTRVRAKASETDESEIEEETLK
jgi:IS5 family transposase